MMAYAGRDSGVKELTLTFSEFIKQMAEKVLHGARESVMPLSKLTTFIRNDPNCKYLQLKPASLHKILQGFPDTFSLQGPPENTNVSLHSGIGICENVKNCLSYPKCKDLHICKYFVHNNCAHTRRNTRCKYPHSFTTGHNRKVLQHHHLSHVDIETIKRLARGSTDEPTAATATVPPLNICYYYTRRFCNRDRCSYLHLCEFFVKGTCKFGRRCKKNHDVYNRDVQAILKENNVDTNGDERYILENIRAEIYGDDEEEEGEEEEDDDEEEEEEDEDDVDVPLSVDIPHVNGRPPVRSYTNFRKRDRH